MVRERDRRRQRGGRCTHAGAGSSWGASTGMFLGDLRERASIEAIEAERSRVARDLHDEPLQHLAGAIKRLEARPENADVTSMLRSVADQLREASRPNCIRLCSTTSASCRRSRSSPPVDPRDASSRSRSPRRLSTRPRGDPRRTSNSRYSGSSRRRWRTPMKHAGCSELRHRGVCLGNRIDLRITDDGTGLLAAR